MKKALLVVPVVALIIIGVVLFKQSNESTSNPPPNTNAVTTKTTTLTPISKITHGHGLALTSDNKLYIATHHGLLMLENDTDLFQVGNTQDDYMGFSSHPTNSQVFFSSGHPSSGGNIGFQKSEDNGFTWQKVSDGLNGPVDFHAMTVSPVNPDLVYGSYQGAVHRSIDGGKTWEKFPAKFIIVNLAADPTDENIVYAASPQGLFVSKDKGQIWQPLLEVGTSGFISTVAIDPNNSKNLLVNAEDMGGLIMSNDSGATWKNLDQNLNGETPLYIAFNKSLINMGYLLTEKNSIYKTTNNGVSWNKIR